VTLIFFKFSFVQYLFSCLYKDRTGIYVLDIQVDLLKNNKID